MTMYAIQNNRLRAARMRFGCDGRVRAYRERAWEIALKEARQRSILHSLVYAVAQWFALTTRSVD